MRIMQRTKHTLTSLSAPVLPTTTTSTHAQGQGEATSDEIDVLIEDAPLMEAAKQATRLITRPRPQTPTERQHVHGWARKEEPGGAAASLLGPVQKKKRRLPGYAPRGIFVD
jgi:hypothetical protein